MTRPVRRLFRWFRARDQEVIPVLEPVAPVWCAVLRKPSRDRRFQRLFPVRADEPGDPAGGDERTPEHFVVSIVERPGAVEALFWRESSLGGEILEHAWR